MPPVPVHDNIWADVRPHTWKWEPRALPPELILIHATRSGIIGRTALQEYLSTINWFKSPSNGINDRGDPQLDWGGMSNRIIGGGRHCLVMPDGYYPTYSLGHGDPIGLSIELGQARNGVAYEPRDLDMAAQLSAEWCGLYNIRPVVLVWLSEDNREKSGIARHDRSANGRYYGKTDPGEPFNDAQFAADVQRYMGAGAIVLPAPPTAEEIEMATALARIEMSGLFEQLASDVHQGFKPDANVSAALLALIGPNGATATVTYRQHGTGLLLYAQACALRGVGVNEQAMREIRYLVKNRPANLVITP